MEPQTISSDLIRGHIDTIILHTLIEGDKFAQQISDFVEEKSNGEYKMNQATLYSSLKRLENLKYVSSYWFDSNESNGRRKYFKITELGANTVKTNLDNWSYSRALIDKLVDCSPQPIYQTQIVEKIVEIPVKIDSNDEKVIETPPQPQPQLINFQEKTIAPEENKLFDQATQEINFRNILNGLIKASQPKKEKTQAKLEPVVKTPLNQEKLNFNETISNIDYNAHKTQNNGKIDFGDLVIKASKEGYKVRISSKDSIVNKGKLLINKLNLFSSLATYLVFLVEFLLVAILAKNVMNFSALAIILTVGLASIFPVIMAVVYFYTPLKRTNKLIYADTIFTTAIIIFNLSLITFAGNLIFGLDFSNMFDLLVYLVLPVIVYVDVLLFFTIKYYLAKAKAFHCNNK